jgi:hypothetical protein
MKHYSIELAKPGMAAGEYISEYNYISWSYILIGELRSNMIKLLNIQTGKIGYARPTDIYLPDPPKSGMYINYEQEGMATGDIVTIRDGKLLFEIKHIKAKDLTCDLKYEGSKSLIRGVPLSYLHYPKKRIERIISGESPNNPSNRKVVEK